MYYRSGGVKALTNVASALSDSSVPCSGVLLQSNPGDAAGSGKNVGTIYFGDVFGQPHKLNPGDSIIVECNNLSEVFVKSSEASGENLLWSYWTLGSVYVTTTTTTTTGE